MAQTEREHGAAQAYLRLLQGKGVAPEQLAQRREMLLWLLPLLVGQPHDGNVYREQVEVALLHVDKSLWPAFLAMAREYYYFWTDDLKAVVALNTSGGFDVGPPPPSLPLEDLRELWQGLDAEKFSLAENWPLKAYASALRDEGAEKAVVETRGKLARLLLVRLRSVDTKDDHQFRIAVDSTLSLFAMRETRLLFLLVVREFYYFWVGDPQAQAHIVLDIRQPTV